MELRIRLLLSLACAAQLGLPQAAYAELAALTRLQSQGASVTAAIVDLDDARVVEALGADQRLTPASLSKLVVAAAALEQWPVDKTFVTRLMAAGETRDGVLQGDLVLQGAGDSSLDAEKLWSLAVQLRALGLGRVAGGLRVDPGPFPTLPCETRDRCEGQVRTDRSYNALLSGVGMDYGNWCIQVFPGVEGEPAGLRSCAGVPLPIPVDGRITTGRPGSRATLRIERLTGPAGDRLRVGGSLPPGTTERVYRAMSDPTQATGQLLRAMLRQVGITVAGEVVTVDAGSSTGTGLRPLAEVESLQLREQVARMMRYSNNYMADVLTLNLAAERDGVAPATLSASTGALLGFLAREPGSGGGASGAAPILLSGSGLTPENRLSARDLTDLLLRQYRDSRRFPVFYGSLVVPREAPFPYLRRGEPDWLDRVALKTGTLTEPHSVTGIAGYLRKRGGGFLAFAIIVNGSDQRLRIPVDDALGAAREDLLRVLARY